MTTTRSDLNGGETAKGGDARETKEKAATRWVCEAKKETERTNECPHGGGRRRKARQLRLLDANHTAALPRQTTPPWRQQHKKTKNGPQNPMLKTYCFHCIMWSAYSDMSFCVYNQNDISKYADQHRTVPEHK